MTTCSHVDTKSSVRDFVYDGNAIGPIPVQRESVMECRQCGEVLYSRADAKRWERTKLLELIAGDRGLGPREMRFLRESTGVTLAQFASLFGVERTTAYRWETDGPPKGMNRPIRAVVLLALLAFDAEAMSERTLSIEFVKSVAAQRLRLMRDAVPGIDLLTIKSEMATGPTLQSHEIIQHIDAKVFELAALENIRKGNPSGWHYFANAQLVTGASMRALLEMNGVSLADKLSANGTSQPDEARDLK